MPTEHWQPVISTPARGLSTPQQRTKRAKWVKVRLAVMLRLVRQKFRQHPDLAARLIATGDGRLINSVDFSSYWGNYRQGRNWLGRILELVRAELLESA